MIFDPLPDDAGALGPEAAFRHLPSFSGHLGLVLTVGDMDMRRIVLTWRNVHVYRHAVETSYLDHERGARFG